jgi:lipopolysaccharide transport system permease protein
MFLAPLFYPIEQVPHGLRPYLYLNPVTIPIEQARVILFWGDPPDMGKLVFSFSLGILLASTGYWCFMRARRGFADVL